LNDCAGSRLLRFVALGCLMRPTAGRILDIALALITQGSVAAETSIESAIELPGVSKDMRKVGSCTSGAKNEIRLAHLLPQRSNIRRGK